MRHLALPLLGVLSLCGCALGPGQHLKVDDGWQSGEPAETQVTIHDISPRLVAKLESLREKEAELPDWLRAYTPDSYQLGAGDVLQITVWDHPELTVPAGTQFSGDSNGRMIRKDGTIFYPYVGSVKAAGLTTDQVRADLAKRLVPFIDRPQVDVAVQRYGSQRIYLSGAFTRNEPLALTNVPTSLAEAIGKAGINTQDADLAGLQLKRGNMRITLNLDELNRRGVDLQTVYLQDGDSLFLPYSDRKKVYVMGEVAVPRALTFKAESVSLAEALGQVSGLRPETAKATQVYVIRAPEGQEVPTSADIYRMDANQPLSWVLANRFALLPGDIIYVSPAGITRWNRLISQLFPSAGIIQASQALTNN